MEIRTSRICMNSRAYLIGIFRDVTERKRTEEQIHASLKEKEVFE